jgi:hypothetical protein
MADLLGYRFTPLRHTIEELQQTSKTKLPPSPSVKVLNVIVPMSCCDQAAEYLIDALGGEAATREIVGGTTWWQGRMINGWGFIFSPLTGEINSKISSVDGEWMVSKKDLKPAKERTKSFENGEQGKEGGKRERERSAQESDTSDSSSAEDTSGSRYPSDMDGLKCILFFHGGKASFCAQPSFFNFLTWYNSFFSVGGYYFGSIDQERYSIQRFARKMGGRVFGK